MGAHRAVRLSELIRSVRARNNGCWAETHNSSVHSNFLELSGEADVPYIVSKICDHLAAQRAAKAAIGPGVDR